MERELKRQQRTIGAIVEIPLENGFKTYARILDPFMAFYDVYTKEQPSIDEIISKPVLFFSTVYDYVITKGYWLKIGKKLPLEDKLNNVPPFYTQDILSPNNYTIYKNGKGIPATKEECKGLEYLAVWKHLSMEERLNDHFNNLKNEYVEKMRNAEVHSRLETKTTISKKPDYETIRPVV